MDALIEAALRDQERRVLEATPAEINGRKYTACRNCGGKTRTNNRSGFCSKKQVCVLAADRERRKG